MATQSEVGKHLGVTRQTVISLIKRGALPKAKPGEHDLDVCRLAYLRHLEARIAERDGKGGSLAGERARLTKEQADALEMSNAELRSNLFKREDVRGAIIGSVSRVQTRLLGVAPEVAGRVASAKSPAEAEAIIRDATYQALSDLADTSVGDLCGGAVDD